MKHFTAIDLKAMLLTRIALSTQKQVAVELGMPAQFINDVVHGRRALSENLATAMGFKKMPDFYVRKQSSSTQPKED